MEFKGKRKRKFEAAGKFVKKIKRIQKETKVTLEKVQEKIKKYADRKQGKGEEYKVRDLILLSMKDLK